MKKKKIFLGILLIAGIIAFLGSSQISFGTPPKPPRPIPTPTPEPKGPTPEPTKPRIELFYLSIMEFRTTTADIALGDEQTLRWSVYVKNVRNLRMEIIPDVGNISLARNDYTGQETREEKEGHLPIFKVEEKGG